MKEFLDRAILGVPVFFLKQYPYAWIAAVTLWTRSPLFAGLFAAIVGLGPLALRWQSAAWISTIRRKHAGEHGKFHVDQPAIFWQTAVRNIFVLIVVSVLLAFLLRDRIGWSFWQILLMAVGFTILHQDTRFFGAAVTYVITATGIAIRFVPGALDYRLFLPFKEISRIEKSEYRKDCPWDIFARSRDVQEGLLMTPKYPGGFTKRIEKLFIAPQDRERFLAELPHGYGGNNPALSHP